ncbi:asparagine synthase-related protein [Candidatus Lucifugimonas marina]|uniref:asparagine synthase (glutamine-hydrolyzing) n=1 Tax=Candidatus Lucifugimonas marina TaxID=3038979 RepID=A0AAJ6CUJ2_9CHLR|nr:hypothetical protein [SAR202 cluster bacterium JH702]MDG0868230.1 hypothetical protein [SAR202 cluster bacterium JH639]WFG34874.1 hypothetical protein GKN94_03965 [SAR202 cluster bacterium JH545]WFG38825.1 hypothetical protein GKO48_04100 [SAR202 cluster bacterium JH1073]
MTNEDQSKVLILGTKPRVAGRSKNVSSSITVYGSPSINGRTAKNSELDGLVSDPLVHARSFDGEFLVVTETSDTVQIINDRFAAHPLFYVIDGEQLVISFSYHELWKWLSRNNRLNIDPLAFYEFLHFQRLFGETTFDQSSKALTPATILTFDSQTRNLTTKRYWTPNFDKRSDGKQAIASDLAKAVKRSIATKISDAEAPSLLLSGGMDSRVVLGGFSPDQLPHCITVGELDNNEVDVARSLAELIGAEHSFVRRSSGHYTDILPTAVVTGGGMYSFQHGHFFDLDLPETDLVLHGHGFDYFFQGMYLPATRNKFLGRPTRSYSLDEITPSVAGQYTQEAKYRPKGTNPLTLLQPATADEAMGRIVSDLESVLEPIAGTTDDPYDRWDYLTTSAPGRHYTYLNLLSAGTLAEQRTIAFTNEIFDLYYSTPAKVRHGTTLLAETIKQLDPRLLTVRNANTNMRPDLSPNRLTFETWMRGLKRRVGLGGSGSTDPRASDRSWPTDYAIARDSESIRNRIENLATSDALDSLGIFDHSKLESLVKNVQNSNESGSSALLTLLTIDEFLTS